MTRRTCSTDGCARPHHARGMCRAHWKRWRRRVAELTPVPGASRSVHDRFWAKVAKSDDCWIWTGATSSSGYGQIRDQSQRMTAAHRWSYEQAVGPIPDGKQLDHLCHTRAIDCSGGRNCPHRACVNPSHLQPVTSRENTMRGLSLPASNARKTECIHGHPFTESNTYLRPDGERECRSCQRSRPRTRATTKEA